MRKKVMVTGSRKWTNRTKVFDVLDDLNPEVVIHGGAVGADSIADSWCKSRGRISQVHYPDWQSGKGAALRRNVEMLQEGPALVVAFPAPDSRGTRYTIRHAKKLGIPVRVHEQSDGGE